MMIKWIIAGIIAVILSLITLGLFIVSFYLFRKQNSRYEIIGMLGFLFFLIVSVIVIAMILWW